MKEQRTASPARFGHLGFLRLNEHVLQFLKYPAHLFLGDVRGSVDLFEGSRVAGLTACDE